MITVVIPYYQRESGILAKALASIAAQKDCPLPVHVIVVDDASPISVGPELAIAGPMPCTVQVITQANAGPGAARNTGLDSAPSGTRYIAFLDSDDEWTQDHLARGIAALECGYDFYFADHYQLGQTTSAFERAGRIQPAQHPTLLNASGGLHAYQGEMLDQIIRGNVIGTSTVVFDFERFADQRFKVEFTNAGEDYLFWMTLAYLGAKIAFSDQSEARYGRGINVYARSGWGTEQHILRIYNELKYRKLTGKLFPLNDEQRQHVGNCVRELRLTFARELLHRIKHRKPIPWMTLKQTFKLDPLSFLLLPGYILQSFYSRLT